MPSHLDLEPTEKLHSILWALKLGSRLSADCVKRLTRGKCRFPPPFPTRQHLCKISPHRAIVPRTQSSERADMACQIEAACQTCRFKPVRPSRPTLDCRKAELALVARLFYASVSFFHALPSVPSYVAALSTSYDPLRNRPPREEGR